MHKRWISTFAIILLFVVGSACSNVSSSIIDESNFEIEFITEPSPAQTNMKATLSASFGALKSTEEASVTSEIRIPEPKLLNAKFGRKGDLLRITPLRNQELIRYISIFTTKACT